MADLTNDDNDSLMSSDDDDEDEDMFLQSMERALTKCTQKRSSLRNTLSAFTKMDIQLDEEYMEAQCEYLEHEMNDAAEYYDGHTMQQQQHTVSGCTTHSDQAAINMALVVGCNDYDELEQLKTPHSDVHLLEMRLRDQQYTVGTLLNEDVTRESLIHELNELDKQDVPPHSKFIFHYSGHGKENRLCMPYYTERDPEATSLTHLDLIRHMPKKFSQVLIVLDCCYAGTIESLQRDRTLLASIPVGQTIHVVCSTRSDISIEDDFNGLFSSSLCRALRNASLERLAEGGTRVSFGTLFERISHDVINTSVANVGCLQHPQLFSLVRQEQQKAPKLCAVPEFHFDVRPRFTSPYVSRSIHHLQTGFVGAA